MANNKVQEGKTIELTAPVGGVVSGKAYAIGSIIGVAAVDAVAGEKVNFHVEGVFELTKDTNDVITEGQEVFLDNATQTIHNASATGLFSAGQAIEAELAAATTCKVRLAGVPVTAAS